MIASEGGGAQSWPAWPWESLRGHGSVVDPDAAAYPHAPLPPAAQVKDFSEYVSQLATVRRANLLTQRGVVEPLACAAGMDDAVLMRRLAALSSHHHHPLQALRM